MAFELRDHTADVAVAATGDTLEAAVAALADGLAAACCDATDVPSDRGDRFEVAVAAGSLDALVFDYLDELIYLRDVREELPVDNEVSIERSGDGGASDDADAGPWHLEGSARGVALSAVDAREVKAVTYSEMRIEQTDDGWQAYVVFDV